MSNFDVVVTKLDEVHCRVICREKDIEDGINDFFKYDSPNAKYRRNRNWDGKIRLFRRDNATLPIGVVNILWKYCKANKLKIQIDPKLMVKNPVDIEQLEKFICDEFDPRDGEGEPLIPYDYQLDAIHHSLVYQRATLLAATSAGKSLILYCLSRLRELSSEGRVVIVVPTKGLVEQLYSDFQEYSNNGGDWHVHEHCQKMNGDYSKIADKPIIIGTWQTLEQFGKHFWNEVGTILIDETHLAKAKSFQSILSKCTEADMRVGMTGTLDNCEVNKLAIAGMLGPVKRIIKAHELQEQGRATPVDITMLALNYSQEERELINEPIYKTERDEDGEPVTVVDGKAMFDREMKYIVEHEKRNEFILTLISKLKGNTLVLSDRVESHLEPLYEATKRHHVNTFIIVGTGKYGGEDKERIRKELDNIDDAIVFASYGTTSTGINIKSLANLVTIYSTQSVIRILQSIGRLLRLYKGKKVSKIFDIFDDFRLAGKSKPNAAFRHAFKRAEYYKEERYPYRIQKINLAGKTGH